MFHCGDSTATPEVFTAFFGYGYGYATSEREIMRARREERTTVRFQIGLLLFPRLTQLDLTGPYEVFIRFPDTDVHLVSKSPEPVVADGGMRLVPSTTFAECPNLDLVCVPGGAGMNPLLNDRDTLDFLRHGRRPAPATSRRSARVRWCSGRPGCCAEGGPPPTGCRFRCSPPSGASPSPNGWSSTAT